MCTAKRAAITKVVIYLSAQRPPSLKQSHYRAVATSDTVSMPQSLSTPNLNEFLMLASI
ncbi:MAG: hypothetical protein ACFB0D_06960 [Phormidesmis sp.]